VSDVVLVLLGPLVVPECRRALARGWLILARFAAGGLLAFAVVSLLYLWWFGATFFAFFSPADLIRWTLWTSVMVLVAVAVLMVPAVLAGSLAGERERGVLQLLLTTAVTSREIVCGRLVGKLCQVGMVLLAGLPLLALLAAWSGLSFAALWTFVLLLACVSIGEGGVSLLASVVSRRGRDALFGVYVIVLILYLSPLLDRLGLPAAAVPWLAMINPFFSMDRFVEHQELAPALVTSAIWLVLGAAGTAIASARLRASCLMNMETARKKKRRGSVPPVGDRPMIWKELFIERVGTLGRVGRWLGVLITVLVGGVSLGFAAVAGWSLFWRTDLARFDWATMELASFLQETGFLLALLLEFGIGLRAAVSIASERDRGAWDALLVTPLEPGEIVRAKLYGSLNALRWIAGAMILAWTLGLMLGSVRGGEYARWMTGIFTGGTFMAAMGVRCSLAMPSAARAMASVILRWFVTQIGVAVAALSINLLVVGLCLSIWMSAMELGWIPPNAPPTTFFLMSWSLGWTITTNVVLLIITMLVVADTRLRFDRIAGRMAGGPVQSRVDEFLYGHALQPVFLPARKSRKKSSIETPVKPEPVAELT
jgi:ABC-type transport system involved in multi-copper enzyme maturation permease subunit